MPNTLVLEPDILIAQDISEIVRGQLPRAEIVVETNLTTGIKTFESGANWELVIANNVLFQGAMEHSRGAFESSRGVKIMLDFVGDRRKGIEIGWISLSVPFSETTMRGALRLCRGPGSGN